MSATTPVRHAGVTFGYVWDSGLLEGVNATASGGGGTGLTNAELRASPVPVSGTVAVTGTFYQVTQPVSIAGTVAVSGPLTDTQLRASAVPVSGTFFQGTQPISNANLDAALSTLATAAKQPTLVSGRMPVDGSGVTQPVSGTFFQSTQPVSIAATVAVSGPLTDTQLRATPVPVSGTITANQGGAPWSVNQTQWAGTAIDVNSGNKSAGTLRVVLATDQPALTNKLLVTPDSVALPANQSVNVAQFGANNVATGTGASGVGVPRVTVSNDSNVLVTPPTLTKGTQGSTGFSVQHLHDAGRNARIFMLDAITAAPVAEALATVVQWYSNAAVAGTTQPAVVPAGKTLRLTGWKIQYQSLATVGYAVVRVRVNTGGVAVLASPLVASFEAGSGAGATTVAMTGGVTTETGDFPEGLEFPAGSGVGFSFAGYGPTGALTLAGGTRFEVHGYEY